MIMITFSYTFKTMKQVELKLNNTLDNSHKSKNKNRFGKYFHV